MKRKPKSQNAVSNGIAIVCEMASGDSDWSVSFPLPIGKAFDVVTSEFVFTIKSNRSEIQ
jgi:hypothetical protein